MTVGYFTDNNVSHTVMKSFSRAGLTVKHISQFDNTQPGVFYGILRGTGMAMRILADRGIDFWYVDNGYFEAVYMNEGKRKEMTGKYRIVKNGLLEMADVEATISEATKPMKFLMLPPSPYTAFMHDTTPEDWSMTIGQQLHNMGHTRKKRDKDETVPLEVDLADCDAVMAFNSIAVVKAMEMGKAVYTTHGIVDNFMPSVAHYDADAIKSFYADKQFTLEEIQDRGLSCLS